MESPTPVSRYVAQSSKKRVFSSSVYQDVEVLEIPPPPTINRASKPKSSKQKEVICHEIIDVDDDDHRDVMHVEGRNKGKKSMSNTSVGLHNLAIDGPGSDFPKLKYGAPDALQSNLFYGEDEWIDTCYDDIVYDDYSVLDSHFEHMDFPPGVEAPFPWLSSSPENNTKARGQTTLSSKLGNQAASHNPKKSLSSKWSESGPSLNRTTTSSSSTDFLTPKASSGSLPPGLVLSSRKSKRSHVNSNSHKLFPSGSTLAGPVNNHSGYPTVSMSSFSPGVGMHMPIWSNVPLNMLEPHIGPSTFMNGSGFPSMVQDSADNNRGATSARVDQRNVDEIQRDFVAFKKFDTVEDYSDHHFAKNASSAKLKNWAKRIQEEWKILEKDLPDTIFVRVYESRMDLLRAVIIGAEGTPYHDGLFFFDVCFAFPAIIPTFLLKSITILVAFE